MKILIWIVTLIVVYLINELIGLAIGFKIGYAVTAVLAATITKALCGALDKKKNDNASKNVGMDHPFRRFISAFPFIFCQKMHFVTRSEILT